MHRTFNCGIGMVVIVAVEHAEQAIELLLNHGEAAIAHRRGAAGRARRGHSKRSLTHERPRQAQARRFDFRPRQQHAGRGARLPKAGGSTLRSSSCSATAPTPADWPQRPLSAWPRARDSRQGRRPAAGGGNRRRHRPQWPPSSYCWQASCACSRAVCSAYSGRLLNIHPSLLPKYRGLHTHRRALAGRRAASTAPACTSSPPNWTAARSFARRA